VRELALETYDALFIAGKDWELLPASVRGVKIINLVQHVKHADARDDRFAFLSRPAHRLCVSAEVLEAITPHMNGPAHVIPNGVSLEMFAPGAEKARNSILIWARKNPALGQRLHETLLDRGLGSSLLVDYLPRADFAAALRATDIFVALTNPSEGFYLPGLEGMASGCAVVCADAIGNRSFCLHGQTCLMPQWGDYDEHLAMIERLLREKDLKEKIRRAGQAQAQTFSLQNERARFYQFLDEHIFVKER